MEYFVSSSAGKSGCGSFSEPFRTISEAAAAAMAGDIVTVMPGIYREEVNPPRGGREGAPVTYRSAEPRKAVITGAEEIKGWKRWKGTIYTVELDASLFGSYNPYTEILQGDWLNSTGLHAGEVYLNGRAMHEVTSMDELESTNLHLEAWDPSFSLYKWFTEQKEGKTILYADFQGADPEKESVEINVRRRCFFPADTGINYITVSGFVLCKAATTWAPPTAFQDGMIGPHWSRGWIIENCEIADSKCSGISLGKKYQPENDNKWTRGGMKDGSQTEREVICLSLKEGWNRENTGSHIIRNCEIHDCGQAGIVGHLGCVFSLIENNSIHHINTRRELIGSEIGGIKLHAAIDTVIRNNRIHHCTRGIWLDWQAQGTRVSGNVFYENVMPEKARREKGTAPGEDLFIEVSHGPTIVDNNIFLSPFPLKLAAQGTAFIHNLFCGPFTSIGIGTNNGKTPNPRYTPYHMPHDTAIMGFMTILHGDDRFYGNIFTGSSRYTEWAEENTGKAGTSQFNGYPDPEEYFSRLQRALETDIRIDRERYYDHLPVYSRYNVYCMGAEPFDKESDAEIISNASIDFEERKDGIHLKTNLFSMMKQRVPAISSEDLGTAFEPEERFENPDGSSILFDTDIHGVKRTENSLPGPFSSEESAKLPL